MNSLPSFSQVYDLGVARARRKERKQPEVYVYDDTEVCFGRIALLGRYCKWLKRIGLMSGNSKMLSPRPMTCNEFCAFWVPKIFEGTYPSSLSPLPEEPCIVLLGSVLKEDFEVVASWVEGSVSPPNIVGLTLRLIHTQWVLAGKCEFSEYLLNKAC